MRIKFCIRNSVQRLLYCGATEHHGQDVVQHVIDGLFASLLPLLKLDCLHCDFGTSFHALFFGTLAESGLEIMFVEVWVFPENSHETVPLLFDTLHTPIFTNHFSNKRIRQGAQLCIAIVLKFARDKVRFLIIVKVANFLNAINHSFKLLGIHQVEAKLLVWWQTSIFSLRCDKVLTIFDTKLVIMTDKVEHRMIMEH